MWKVIRLSDRKLMGSYSTHYKAAKRCQKLNGMFCFVPQYAIEPRD